MLDDRAKLLLRTLVDRYIADGQPVGSRALSQMPGLELSSATIRNIMADLEDLGLLASPHTSAGRIPTARGYRMVVDAMLTAEPAGLSRQIPASLTLEPEQPKQVVAKAAHMLSDLSQFVGVVVSPRRGSAFRHIDFLRLSERRVLVILVSPGGDVQNRVLFTETDFDQPRLTEAASHLNQHYSGMDMEQVRASLRGEVEHLQGEIAALMEAAIQASAEELQDHGQDVVIVGERNLLSVTDFSSDMTQLRRAFELFEQKTQLMRLLDESIQAAGVHIYIGGERGSLPAEELSVASAPHHVGGQVVGTLGVIGPVRMPYRRMVDIVDITSKLVSGALSPR